MPLDGMLEKLYSRRRFGIRPGLDRVTALLGRLGNPQNTFRSIHVVGTNGKGSTSAFLSAILAAAGQQPALFTSPHLVNFNERFRINDRDIDTPTLAAAMERVMAAAAEETTFFEVVTALAALLFAENGVSVAVMEAGMGGRSDATAALPGIMTLVTPISLDHCDYLGHSIEAIAAEKSAIAEAATMLVSAAQTEGALQQIKGHASESGIRMFAAGVDFYTAWQDNGLLDYNGIHVKMSGLSPGIPGLYQSGNAGLAMAAAELLPSLGIPVTVENINTGIAKARWPGRMELIPGNPRIMLDGAHNPDGALALQTALTGCCYNKLLLVTGVMADKDVSAVLSPLVPKAETVFCVTPSVERALGSRDLCTVITGMGGSAMDCGCVADGIARAVQAAGPDDLVLICGSLFTVGEAKAVMSGKQFKGIRG